jgi:hypothetical protein
VILDYKAFAQSTLNTTFITEQRTGRTAQLTGLPKSAVLLSMSPAEGKHDRYSWRIVSWCLKICGEKTPHLEAVAERTSAIRFGFKLVAGSFYLENCEYFIGRGDRYARDEMSSRLAPPIVE